MKNLVKGLMLSAVIAFGATTAQAQGTGTGTGAEDVQPATSTEFWMGENAVEGRFYLYNVGANIFATDNTPSETDITKATLWTANGSNDKFSFTDEKGNLVITMNSYNVEITKKLYLVSATKLGLETGTTKGKGNAYKLVYTGKIWPNPTRYLNVDNDKYTSAHTPGTYNDWLFISDAQKNAYDEYVKLFNEAKSYTEAGSKLFESDDHEKTDAIVKQLNDALKSYNYNTYKEENGGKAQLEAAINAAKDFITTGINEISSTTDAKVAEIYGANGARKSQLTKGLNIVKMSDGTVKKVLVK